MMSTPDADPTRPPAPPPPAWLGWPAVAVSTVLGIGTIPLAPGTWGTAAAVPLVWLCAGMTHWGYLAVCVGVTVLAIACAGLTDRTLGEHDSQRIVSDEVAGYFWTLLAVADRTDPVALAVGFVLFRAADIVKPWPARAIDDRLPGGAGVVLDDVVAGWWAALALLALDRSGLLGYIHWP
jgi:phosphatidylglycerophosphatase A